MYRGIRSTTVHLTVRLMRLVRLRSVGAVRQRVDFFAGIVGGISYYTYL